jgi:hypothetical protein
MRTARLRCSLASLSIPLTFAETMLSKYETLLQTSAGLDSVMVDGQSARYADVEAKCRYWKREVACEKGRRPQAAMPTTTRRPVISALRPAMLTGQFLFYNLGGAPNFRGKTVVVVILSAVKNLVVGIATTDSSPPVGGSE